MKRAPMEMACACGRKYVRPGVFSKHQLECEEHLLQKEAEARAREADHAARAQRDRDVRASRTSRKVGDLVQGRTTLEAELLAFFYLHDKHDDDSAYCCNASAFFGAMYDRYEYLREYIDDHRAADKARALAAIARVDPTYYSGSSYDSDHEHDADD